MGEALTFEQHWDGFATGLGKTKTQTFAKAYAKNGWDFRDAEVESMRQQKEQAEAACAEMRELVTDGFRLVAHSTDGIRLSTDPIIRSLDDWLTKVSEAMNKPNPGSTLLTELHRLREEVKK